MVKENNIYVKKLHLYLNVLNKSDVLIKKYNGQITAKKKLQNKYLKKTNENIELSSKINKKLKRYPLWHALCTSVIFLLMFGIISPINIIVLPGKILVNFNYLAVLIFTLLATLSNLGISNNKGELRKKVSNAKKENTLLETKRTSLDKEVAKLREQIAKVEKVKQYTKKQIDNINKVLDEYEAYIGLQNPQETFSQNKACSKPTNKELKNKLY